MSMRIDLQVLSSFDFIITRGRVSEKVREERESETVNEERESEDQHKNK